MKSVSVLSYERELETLVAPPPLEDVTRGLGATILSDDEDEDEAEAGGGGGGGSGES